MHSSFLATGAQLCSAPVALQCLCVFTSSTTSSRRRPCPVAGAHPIVQVHSACPVLGGGDGAPALQATEQRAVQQHVLQVVQLERLGVMEALLLLVHVDAVRARRQGDHPSHAHHRVGLPAERVAERLEDPHPSSRRKYRRDLELARPSAGLEQLYSPIGTSTDTHVRTCTSTVWHVAFPITWAPVPLPPSLLPAANRGPAGQSPQLSCVRLEERRFARCRAALRRPHRAPHLAPPRPQGATWQVQAGSPCGCRSLAGRSLQPIRASPQ
eukprot:scaffold2585_cov368-Prasinococcus_capsulatus_cf.AAC.4